MIRSYIALVGVLATDILLLLESIQLCLAKEDASRYQLRPLKIRLFGVVHWTSYVVAWFSPVLLIRHPVIGGIRTLLHMGVLLLIPAISIRAISMLVYARSACKRLIAEGHSDQDIDAFLNRVGSPVRDAAVWALLIPMLWDTIFHDMQIDYYLPVFMALLVTSYFFTRRVLAKGASCSTYD